jgi:hypothetical protein
VRRNEFGGTFVSGLISSLACIFILLFLAVPAAYADPSLSEAHEDWFSLIYDESDELLFRATTGKLQKGFMSAFVIDSPLSACNRVLFTVTLSRAAEADADMLVEKLLGQMRVDRAPIRNIVYAVYLVEGSDTMHLTIENYDRSDTILAEIMAGRVARFKFNLGEDELYFNFSLMGATAAIMRADQLCRDYETTDPDKRYFDEEDGGNRDEDYFDT